MPQDRLLHPRQGHSAKVAGLTDLEFRVWIQYLLSADDFGVMRGGYVTFQSDNDALHGRPPKVIQRAIDHLVSVGLIAVFAHQGRDYLYQPTWQAFQKVEYPRATIEPIPPFSALSLCEEDTRALFLKHPGGTRKRPKDMPSVSREHPEGVPNDLEQSATTRARPRETAKANANANASSEGVPGKPSRLSDVPSPALAKRAADFLETYDGLYEKHRQGARHLRRQPALDWDRACDLCRKWDDARLVKMAEILLTTDDEWIAKTDRGFAVFVSKATWCDDRLAAWEAGRKVSA